MYTKSQIDYIIILMSIHLYHQMISSARAHIKIVHLLIVVCQKK